MSNLTQRAMAASIAELLRTKALDKITIRDITDHCGVTRNTFYYHFHDVYDLLSWLFRDKTDQIMSKYTDEADWEGGLEEVLAFVHENRQMIMHIYETISYDDLTRFVNDIVFHHVKVVVSIEARGMKVHEEAIALTADFYKHAIVGTVLEWIRSGMEDTPESLAHICNGMFSGTVEQALLSAERSLKGA